MAEQQVRIVFSDIDGTFLTNDKRTTEVTAQAVRDLLARGIPFVLVSARMPEAIYPITRRVGVTIPIISYSGGYVLTEQEEVLFDRRMAAADTAGIIGAIERKAPQVTLNYYAGRHWYVRGVDKRVQYEMDITGAQAEIVPFEELSLRGEAASKLLVMGEPEDCSRLQRELSAAFTGLNVVLSAPFLLEIMDASVSKATGIKVLLEHFGIKAGEALAFGDNYNDVEMLDLAGTGVAMGNAPEAVKAHAAAVTESNEEDGLARYLRRVGVI